MYAWSDSDSISLVCLKKWHETPDTVSFELGSIPQDLHFNFKPGQFITLGLNMPQKMEKSNCLRSPSETTMDGLIQMDRIVTPQAWT